MRFTRLAFVPAIATLIAGLVVAPAYSAGNSKNDCTALDGEYIVSFIKGAVVANEIKNINGRDVSPRHIFSQAINGFAGFLTSDQVCNLQKRGNVLAVEIDQEVSIDAVSSQTIDATLWGLDRIDTNSLTTKLDNRYTYEASTAGKDVDVYVIDTGLLANHSEFIGRVNPGFTAIKDGRNTSDCDGHGTHVAGTIGGTTYGVAKSVRITPVRVLNCKGSGKWSGVIAGIDWIINDHIDRKAVANMSLGGAASTTLDTAVNNLINDGVVVVVAAGNSAKDAGTTSPARVDAAITVAASDKSDIYATWSNFGSKIDLIAPGVNIKSAWIGSPIASSTISGTSMASPHVAGAVARLLSASASSTSTNSSTATNVSVNLIADSTKGVIAGVSSNTNTPNNFLYINPNK